MGDKFNGVTGPHFDAGDKLNDVTGPHVDVGDKLALL